MNTNQDLIPWPRRKFLKAAIGGSAMAMTSQLGLVRLAYAQHGDKNELTMILVDYGKCTGCRTCETACSAFNHPRTFDGEVLNGLGNPDLANIRVCGYNPDVDIPAVCAMCPDSPCIEACPVDPDPKTGWKALYREEKNLTIRNDPDRCIGCGSCAEACRAGIIILNAETDRPEHICNLCGGEPQCVKHCPFEALSRVKVDVERRFYAMKPEQIAHKLIEEWYGASGSFSREGATS
jgi:carbon-monoxide dehydrogenase iron sulfur subunit